MKEISLTQGKVCIVDDEDYEPLMQWRWKYAKCGYAMRTAYEGGIYLHRLITDVPAGTQIDHINGDKLDNRKANLRFATQQQNNMNSSSRQGSSSQYKGVSWNKAKQKWTARIKLNMKQIHLQHCDYEVEAAVLYDEAAKASFGKWARLNFPEGPPANYPKTVSTKTSQYRGVAWSERDQRWVVKLMKDDKQVYSAYCKNEVEAALLYDEAAKTYHGKEAKLNWPGGYTGPVIESTQRKTSSQYTGVTYIKAKNLWRAQLNQNGKRLFLKHFKKEEDAARAYDHAAMQMLGKPPVNFPL